MSARRKYLIAALIALLWGAAMLAAFWWFEARYLRTFDERAAVFSGAELHGLVAGLTGLVLTIVGIVLLVRSRRA